MDSEIPTEQNTPPATTDHPPRARRRYIPNVFGCSFAVLAVVVLAGMISPFGSHVGERSWQSKSLASAKQIGLALKLYAGDNDGNFPTAIGDPASATPATGTATTSNAAFANLFPTYCSAEKLFHVPKSAYCHPVPPDEVYNSKDKCLAPGENNYGYVAGLTDNDNATFPLVMDGTDGTGHYVTDQKKRGGVWLGKKAILIHVDNSGEVVNLTGPANARFIPRSHDDPTHNLLDAAFLKSIHARLLDPIPLGAKH